MWKFDPTANLNDFDAVPNLRDAWSEMIDASYDENINGRAGWDPDKPLSRHNPTPFAVEELKAWGRTASDLRYFNPTHMDVRPSAAPIDVNWNALPTSFNDQFGGDPTKILTFLDSPQEDPQAPAKTRVQDEYCEWVVTEADGKITKVVFTSEPPEYYDFLFNPPKTINKDATRTLSGQYLPHDHR